MNECNGGCSEQEAPLLIYCSDILISMLLYTPLETYMLRFIYLIFCFGDNTSVFWSVFQSICEEENSLQYSIYCRVYYNASQFHKDTSNWHCYGIKVRRCTPEVIKDAVEDNRGTRIRMEMKSKPLFFLIIWRAFVNARILNWLNCLGLPYKVGVKKLAEFITDVAACKYWLKCSLIKD